MKLFTFEVTGASPGPGIVLILCATKPKARKLALKEVERENEMRKMSDAGYSKVSLSDKEPTIEDCGKLPCCVYFDSGER